jgi:hypothetical protein
MSTEFWHYLTYVFFILLKWDVLANKLHHMYHLMNFVFAKIFVRFSRKFSRKRKFLQNEISRNFAKIVPFSHDFRIFAKIEKCIFVSTLVPLQRNQRHVYETSGEKWSPYMFKALQVSSGKMHFFYVQISLHVLLFLTYSSMKALIQYYNNTTGCWSLFFFSFYSPFNKP